MTIGEALKKERENLGLTQAKFSEGIISAAHYSKVERDKHEISAKDLLALLKKNNISFEDFGNEIVNIYNSEDNNSNLSLEIIHAFYHHDKDEILLLNKKIQSSSASKEEKLRAILITANVTHTIDKISPKTVKEIKRMLFESPDWTRNEITIRLFSNSLLIFTDNEFNFYVNSILDSYLGRLEKEGFYMQKIIAVLCINCLDICYSHQNIELVSKICKLINELPEFPDFFIYKALSNYYQDLFKNNNEKAKELRSFLAENGLPNFIKNLPN